MTISRQEVYEFIKNSSKPVTDIDIGEHFGVYEDIDITFEVFMHLKNLIDTKIVKRIPFNGSSNEGCLVVVKK